MIAPPAGSEGTGMAGAHVRPVTLGSVTVTLVSAALPVLVATMVYVTRSPAAWKATGEATLVTAIWPRSTGPATDEVAVSDTVPPCGSRPEADAVFVIVPVCTSA